MNQTLRDLNELLAYDETGTQGKPDWNAQPRAWAAFYSAALVAVKTSAPLPDWRTFYSV